MMNFQNKPTRDVKDFSLLELLRNKENTLRKGNRTTSDPQTNTQRSHEIEPITNSKEDSLERPSI